MRRAVAGRGFLAKAQSRSWNGEQTWGGTAERSTSPDTSWAAQEGLGCEDRTPKTPKRETGSW